MLSILIPNHEFNCSGLVTDLIKLGSELSVPWEIIVLDDGSSERVRNQIRPLQNLSNVTYLENTTNTGRARSRNHLAGTSKYEYLLFLDCDSKICRPDFLDKYIESISKERVVVGSRVYPESKPEPRFVLHWKYGRKRESLSQAFQSNNFIIPKAIFNKIRFDETLYLYGHEDTVFGWHLTNLNIPVLTIDNPVLHLGLETTGVFIEKQHRAVINLVKIKKDHPYIETSLIRTIHRLRKIRIHFVVLTLFPIARNNIIWCLKKTCSLFLLDIIKIGWYLEYSMGLHEKKKVL